MTLNCSKELGGYPGLELGECALNIKPNCISLNTARNSLRYVIKAYKIKEIFVPYYTCPVVWQAIQKENCKINFYHINKDFLPQEEFAEDAFVLYTNYFGICAKNVKLLAKKYRNLIIDNAQAFYMQKYGIASFNSIRKFFGVPDGSLLYCDKKLDTEFETDVSYPRFTHLLKRLDIDASSGYQDFCTDEELLNSEPIKYLSNLTYKIFNQIDTQRAKTIRLENFRILHESLKNSNELKFELDTDDVPMSYPYLIEENGLKQKLISKKIYCATYWNPLPDEYTEGYFQKYLIPLPLDQRYGESDMYRVLEAVYE